jgi:hypothetical protein
MNIPIIYIDTLDESTQGNMSIHHKSNDGVSIVLRREVNLSEDDLSQQAKKQFPNHTKILFAHQLNARNILNDDRLSPIGRHYFCMTLEKSYKNCKNVLNYVADHPQLKTTTHFKRGPFIVCGVARSGTTLLYNLLAQDPTCRAPIC